MKRTGLILLAGLLLACAAYCGVYYLATAADRNLEQDATPELAWLKKEFNLSDAEFKRISDLHAAYQPRCAEMCKRIAAKHAELQELLAQSGTMTPEIQKNLAESAQIRAECQTAMLAHFFEVSRTMPPAEGKRYLEWVEEKAFGTMQDMSAAASTPRHDHGN
jgi:hypothetical protein